jgi:hypothetical protein
MDNLHIPKDTVSQCIRDSFATPGDWESYNVSLGIDREFANHLGGVQMNPSVSINGHPYHGILKADQIFEGVCSAFHYDMRPFDCLTNMEQHVYLQNEILIESKELAEERKIFWHHALILFVFVLFVNILAVVYFYRKK